MEKNEPTVFYPNAKKSKANRGLFFLVLLFVAFCIFTLSASFLFVTAKNSQKAFMGYRIYAVLSSSMEPQPGGPSGGFKSGDMIIVKAEKPENIIVGDIITFSTGSDAFITHRVVEIRDGFNERKGIFFITKGDANEIEDPPVPFERLVGKKVAAIPRLGQLLILLRMRPLVTIIFLLFSFFIWAIILLGIFILYTASRRKRRLLNNQ